LFDRCRRPPGYPSVRPRCSTGAEAHQEASERHRRRSIRGRWTRSSRRREGMGRPPHRWEWRPRSRRAATAGPGI